MLFLLNLVAGTVVTGTNVLLGIELFTTEETVPAPAYSQVVEVTLHKLSQRDHRITLEPTCKYFGLGTAVHYPAANEAEAKADPYTKEEMAALPITGDAVFFTTKRCEDQPEEHVSLVGYRSRPMFNKANWIPSFVNAADYSKLEPHQLPRWFNAAKAAVDAELAKKAAAANVAQ